MNVYFDVLLEPLRAFLEQVGILLPRILLALVRRAGSVVTKDELIQAVWADRPVADGNLTTYVARLRKKLDADVIETAHGKGYRLAAHVERPGSSHELRARYLTQMLREAEEDRQFRAPCQ